MGGGLRGWTAKPAGVSPARRADGRRDGCGSARPEPVGRHRDTAGGRRGFRGPTGSAAGPPKYAALAQVPASLGRTPPEQLGAMLNAGVTSLQGLPSVRRDRIGAVGFCFGGGMPWRLATSNPSLRAAVPFYGPNPPLEDVPKIKAAVLAIYGELDTRIDAGIPAIREAMQRAGITHEIVIYPGANHAFFNDTGERYHDVSAKDAWQRAVAWFGRYLRQ